VETESQLGKMQKWILSYFDKKNLDGQPFASIKDLTKYHFFLKGETIPTKEQINEVHRIVRTLKKRSLVKTWYAKSGCKIIDFKYRPGYHKMIALSNYKGPFYIDEEE